MGINPTPTNYKSLSFDGVSSRSFGVYITGEGVFDAPKRSIEMVEIAGRNGAYAVDNGNFQNIEVKYPAAIVADTESDFADAIADFRSFLCSKYSYCRLEDEYNPDEYRMAIFKNGFEVSHDGLLTGEFELVFDCQPQRFLKSGETAVPITSGDSITNPTLFDAHPLLEISGEGTIEIDGKYIVVNNDPIGDIIIKNSTSYSGAYKVVTVDTTFANVGDTITIAQGSVTYCQMTAPSMTGISSSVTGDGYATDSGFSIYRYLSVGANEATFQYGTAKTVTVTGTYTVTTSAYGTLTVIVTFSITYNGANKFTLETTTTVPAQFTVDVWTVTIGDVKLTSTQSVLGNPLYIDLDLGECYKTVGTETVSVNNGIEMPAELPVLSSGATAITYDNTFTSVKVIPRWWIV